MIPYGPGVAGREFQGHITRNILNFTSLESPTLQCLYDTKASLKATNHAVDNRHEREPPGSHFRGRIVGMMPKVRENHMIQAYSNLQSFIVDVVVNRNQNHLS